MNMGYLSLIDVKNGFMHPSRYWCVGHRLVLLHHLAKWTPLCWEVYALEVPCVLQDVHFVHHHIWTKTTPLDVGRLLCLIFWIHFFIVFYDNHLWEEKKTIFCSLRNLCWWVLSSLSTHTTIPCVILVWFNWRHHNLAMEPYDVPNVSFVKWTSMFNKSPTLDYLFVFPLHILALALEGKYIMDLWYQASMRQGHICVLFVYKRCKPI